MNLSKLQTTIEVQGYIQRGWETKLEAKLIKGQPPMITNRFVNNYKNNIY